METESTPGNVRLNDGLGPNAQAVERDTHRGGSSYEASMLRNLLARIHGDGGHYVEQHGLDKAFEDADALVAALRAAGLGVVAHMEGRESTPGDARLDNGLGASSEALKPCPFCGGHASYDDHRSDFYGLDTHGVECRSCDVRNFAPTKEDAIRAWNRRA